MTPVNGARGVGREGIGCLIFFFFWKRSLRKFHDEELAKLSLLLEGEGVPAACMTCLPRIGIQVWHLYILTSLNCEQCKMIIIDDARDNYSNWPWVGLFITVHLAPSSFVHFTPLICTIRTPSFSIIIFFLRKKVTSWTELYYWSAVPPLK